MWESPRPVYPNELYHYGVKGMHWGIRRYQPYPKGYSGNGKYLGKIQGGSKVDTLTEEERKRIKRRNIAIAAGLGGAALAGTALYMRKKYKPKYKAAKELGQYYHDKDVSAMHKAMDFGKKERAIEDALLKGGLEQQGLTKKDLLRKRDYYRRNKRYYDNIMNDNIDNAVDAFATAEKYRDKLGAATGMFVGGAAGLAPGIRYIRDYKIKKRKKSDDGRGHIGRMNLAQINKATNNALSNHYNSKYTEEELRKKRNRNIALGAGAAALGTGIYLASKKMGAKSFNNALNSASKSPEYLDLAKKFTKNAVNFNRGGKAALYSGLGGLAVGGIQAARMNRAIKDRKRKKKR